MLYAIQLSVLTGLGPWLLAMVGLEVGGILLLAWMNRDAEFIQIRAFPFSVAIRHTSGEGASQTRLGRQHDPQRPARQARRAREEER